MDKETADAISDLQAASIAATTMLDALIMSHPDPKALRDAWDRASAPRLASALTNAAKNETPRQVDVDIAERLQRWTARLEALRQLP